MRTSTEYRVRCVDYQNGEYDLNFELRKDAEEYKRILNKSKRPMGEIIIKKLEVDEDGYIIEEKEI